MIFISSTVIGQSSPKAILGQEIDGEDIELISIIGNNQENTFVLKSLSEKPDVKYLIEKYNQGLKKVASNEIMSVNTKELRKKGDGILPVLKFIQLKEDIFLIEEEQELEKITLRLKKVDQMALTIDKETTHTIELDFWESYELKYSSDKSKFLIHSLTSNKKELSLYVYDVEATKIWNKVLKLPYKDELFDVRDVQFDNDGNVFVIGVEYANDRKRTVGGKANYKFKIYSYTNNGESSADYEVKDKGLFLSEIKMNSEGSQLVFGGFYADEYKLKIQGAFYFLLNKESLNEEFNSFEKFTISEKLIGSREIQKMRNKVFSGHNPDVFTYDLVEIKLNKNDEILLIGEQRYIVASSSVSSTAKNGNPNNRDVEFNSSERSPSDDIIVVNMKSTGKINWVTVIPKEQDGLCFNCSSFSSLLIDSQLYVFYNDMAKNIGQTKGEKIKRHNPFFNDDMVMAKVDENGKITQKVLFDSSFFHFSIPSTYQASNNEMLYVGATNKGKTKKLAKITF